MSTFAIAAAGSNALGVQVRSADPLRLTARGRLVVRLLVLASLLTLTLSVATFSRALIAGAVAGDGSASTGSTISSGALTYHSIKVAPGETLWSIARHVRLPGEDVRTVVDTLTELNHLESAGLVAGQDLIVPTLADRPE
jgi:hypothetical protein